MCFARHQYNHELKIYNVAIWKCTNFQLFCVLTRIWFTFELNASVNKKSKNQNKVSHIAEKI